MWLSRQHRNKYREWILHWKICEYLCLIILTKNCPRNDRIVPHTAALGNTFFWRLWFRNKCILGLALDLQSDRKMFKYFYQDVLGNLQLPHFSLALWKGCHYFQWPSHKDSEEGQKMTTDLQIVCMYISGQPGYCKHCGGWKRRNKSEIFFIVSFLIPASVLYD